MSIYDWQTGILMTMEDSELPSTRSLYYRLPRRSGATTFLTNMANDAVASGMRALFIVKNSAMAHYVKPKLNNNVAIGFRDDRFGGLQYDLVVGDCLGSERVDELSRQVDLSTGFNLFIDTID